MSYTINVTEDVTGSHHDPYAVTIVTIRDGNREAEYYTDGLGREYYTFAIDDVDMFRSEWFSSDVEHKSRVKVMNDACRSFIGVSFEDAESEYHENWEPDPMGSLRSYI